MQLASMRPKRGIAMKEMVEFLEIHARNNGRNNPVRKGDCVRDLVARRESEEGAQEDPTRIEGV